MKLYAFIFIFNCAHFSMPLDCFWNSCQYKKFSSKTPYNCIRDDIRDSVVKLDGCDVISIWTIIRHGKRSPGGNYSLYMKDAISLRNKVKSSYEKGTRFLCAQDVENLINWQVDSELFDKAHSLTREGYQEMFGIGKRLREAFIQLLDKVENGSYVIRSAYGHWVENGVIGFVEGLSNNKSMEIQHLAPQNDSLAVYYRCPKYMKEIRRHPKTYSEYDTYLENKEYLAAKKRIENRVGVELTNDNITGLYDLCRYAWSAIDNKPSPWCALFSMKDLEVMEYAGDLRHYYRNGFGNQLNVLMGEIVISDLYKKFIHAKDNRGVKIVAYFSHATMLDMVVSALGVFNDKMPLTGTFRNVNRKWRSSKVSAFAANLIAVLYRCGNVYKVGFYLNEELLTSMCDNGICSWQEFENKLIPFLNVTLEVCF
ncbi:multiple inositol polyphosphate phosphatase 1-like [Zerene cesonia]|uniref:multiple inositol polyphosphate phosphatase 1-like n=1 Tax=Zerene cesonia TaxID=33412 RepID=UPI0018E4DC5C|nr:multiple inositol polyphosphate phosphatase 1-like [Zerene cesonia]